MKRSRQVRRLREESFDLLVVGGGITGTAVARDAAQRGLRCALVEARDFGEGTSSRSSRLIHGGLRYLEQLDFDLVFEASQERRTLLRIAPHLVRPLEFLFPIYRESRIGKLKLDAGMWLYDALSLFRNIERHQMLDADAVLEREPGLRPDGLLGGARYFDAQVDDARLVLVTALAAIEEGAAVANRVEVHDIERVANGHRLRVRDAESAEEWEIDATSVVNATGPWTDRTRALAGVGGAPLVRPTRGTHVHIRRERLPHGRALIFESAVDGRIMFVLPWRDLTMIGTTDEFDDRPPEGVAPTAEDVRYLLDSTNHLFPEVALSEEDIEGAWAGLRPLAVAGGGADSASEDEISRDFVVQEDPPGLFTVAGGKLTSHRAMAEDTVDEVVDFLEVLGVHAHGECRTAREPLPGGDFDGLDGLCAGIRAAGRKLGVAEAGANRLARAYGTRAEAVLELVRGRPELARPIVDGRPHIGAEVVYAARNEMARHVEDVAYRRTRVGVETRDGFEPACRRIAELMGGELGWDAARMEREIERTRAIRRRDERFRQRRR